MLSKQLILLPREGVQRGRFGYMDLAALNRLLREDRAISGAFLAVDADWREVVYERLKEIPRVAGVQVGCWWRNADQPSLTQAILWRDQASDSEDLHALVPAPYNTSTAWAVEIVGGYRKVMVPCLVIIGTGDATTPAATAAPATSRIASPNWTASRTFQGSPRKSSIRPMTARTIPAPISSQGWEIRP